MATMDQIRRGLIAYADAELIPAMGGGPLKEIALGAGLEYYAAKKLPPLVESLGVVEADGNIDIRTLADILHRRLEKYPEGFRLELKLNPMDRSDVDVFRFAAADVDALAKAIENA